MPVLFRVVRPVDVVGSRRPPFCALTSSLSPEYDAAAATTVTKLMNVAVDQRLNTTTQGTSLVPLSHDARVSATTMPKLWCRTYVGEAAAVFGGVPLLQLRQVRGGVSWAAQQGGSRAEDGETRRRWISCSFSFLS